MIASKIREKPVVTLLSSSAALSHRAQTALDDLFGLKPLETRIDSSVFPSIGFLNSKVHSLASKCGTSGTILHFMSVNGNLEKQESNTLAVLSIIGCSGSDVESIEESRSLVFEEGRKNFLKVMLKKSFGQQLKPSDITGIHDGLPLLRPTDRALAFTDNFMHESKCGLKEVAIPHFDHTCYPNGKSLISTLIESSLTRPVVGLYQFNGGLAIRPLPAGTLDQVLPLPSFVFRCRNMEESIELLKNNGAVTGKIGFSSCRQGQVMVQHPDIPGLDLRLTETSTYISSFPEAQEALLAASLSELQNRNVLLEGGVKSHEYVVSDPMNGVGDCWVEFRATMKQPSRFLKSQVNSPKSLKIAKVQEIPYE